MTDKIQEYLDNGKKRGKELDHYRMLEDICKLVETDFVEIMSWKYSSKDTDNSDAKKMSSILGRIYLIAHCIHCYACQEKFLAGGKNFKNSAPKTCPNKNVRIIVT